MASGIPGLSWGRFSIWSFTMYSNFICAPCAGSRQNNSSNWPELEKMTFLLGLSVKLSVFLPFCSGNSVPSGYTSLPAFLVVFKGRIDLSNLAWHYQKREVYQTPDSIWQRWKLWISGGWGHFPRVSEPVRSGTSLQTEDCPTPSLVISPLIPWQYPLWDLVSPYIMKKSDQTFFEGPLGSEQNFIIFQSSETHPASSPTFSSGLALLRSEPWG